MTAAPPREFKFVGGPSRKRRRNTGPPKSSAPPPPTTAPATAPATTESAAPTSEPENVTRVATPTYTADALHAVLSYLPNPAANGLPEDRADHGPQQGVPGPDAGGVVTTDSMDGPGFFDDRLTTGVDWTYGNFMNPFIDSGLRFGDMFGAPPPDTSQVPFYFGPEMPFLYAGESPSIDSSTDSAAQADFHEEGPTRAGSVGSDMTEAAGSPAIRVPDPHTIPSVMTDTVTRLLELYDREFCVMPLTHDFSSNPFRCAAPSRAPDSQLLLHCVLAVCYKHLNRDTGTCAPEAKTHKRTALKMLREMERADGAITLRSGFLDAVLILMTLSCATSAHGPWVWYLKRAQKVIQGMESLHISKTPRMRATIEILVWWDVTLALTSRQGCVLPESTIMNLFKAADENGVETFYSVSGCPAGLFRYMIRLGAFAREFELSLSMTCVKFDMQPILDAEREIRAWTAPEYHGTSLADGLPEDADSVELAHHNEDLHHVTEAWRYALIVYIHRVFKCPRNQPDTPPPPTLGFLARKTLNHVSSCRRSTMVQKQLLLPVFLAGCETKDERLRQEARDYCAWWNERTRYDMFDTANTLMEEVWADERPGTWWGSVIDQKGGTVSDGRQYLFG